MKIYNINNPEKFLDVVKQCKGEVELVSKQGDRLNMKSELTKYIAITQLFTDNTFINEMELIASNPDDVTLLMDYMMEGETDNSSIPIFTNSSVSSRSPPSSPQMPAHFPYLWALSTTILIIRRIAL